MAAAFVQRCVDAESHLEVRDCDVNGTTAKNRLIVFLSKISCQGLLDYIHQCLFPRLTAYSVQAKE